MNIIMSHALHHHQYHHQEQQHHHQHHHHHIQHSRAMPPPITQPSLPFDFADKIPFRELRLSNETLGSGSFGTVFKGYWRNRLVAVKQFRTREEIDSFLVEVKQLSCVSHPNIVKLFGASVHKGEGSDTAYLVMEYAEGGSLNHLLHECNQQQYDLRHACSWALQTACGVTYLHEMRPKAIMHRDLKPANLLLFSRGKTLKICDFGTACTVRTQMTDNTGSASYMAPEVFATNNYHESGDVYSWSIIFWEILARQRPYSQQCSNAYQILWRVKQDGTRPNKLEGCPRIIWDLITRAWDKDPHRRPSMRQVANEMEFISLFTSRNPSSTASSTPTPTSTPTSTPTPTIPTSNSHIGYANYLGEDLIHHQDHHAINSQSRRRLSSIDDSGRKFYTSSNYPPNNHHHHQHQLFLPHSAYPRNSSSTSTSSQLGSPIVDRSSQKTIDRRKLIHHRDALNHHIEILQKRARELEMSAGSCEETEPNKMIDEIQRLLDEQRKKKEALKQLSESINSLTKNFNNVYLNSPGSIDCD